MSSKITLDVRKLLCPLPVIRLQNAMKTLNSDDTIIVIATDRGVLEDIPVWCRMYGHTILNIEKNEKEIVIEVKKG